MPKGFIQGDRSIEEVTSAPTPDTHFFLMKDLAAMFGDATAQRIRVWMHRGHIAGQRLSTRRVYFNLDDALRLGVFKDEELQVLRRRRPFYAATRAWERRNGKARPHVLYVDLDAATAQNVKSEVDATQADATQVDIAKSELISDVEVQSLITLAEPEPQPESEPALSGLRHTLHRFGQWVQSIALRA